MSFEGQHDDDEHDDEQHDDEQLNLAPGNWASQISALVLVPLPIRTISENETAALGDAIS